jgi:S-layer homology domain/Galactose oxidase, central domain
MFNSRVVAGTAAIAAWLVAAPLLASAPPSASVLQADGKPLVEQTELSAILGTWIPGAPMSSASVRYASAQCLGQNTFYVITGVPLVTTNRRYDAGTNTWVSLADIPLAMQGPSGVCYQGKIYVAGGAPATNTPGTTLFIYDIAANTWSSGATLPRAVWGAAMGANNGKVYMIGGDADFTFGGTSNAVNIYDIVTNTWTGTGAVMPSAAVSAGFAQIGTFVYVVGGWGDVFPANNTMTQRYDMATDTWQPGPVFTSGRADLPVAATGVALYAIGGDNNGGSPFDASVTVERLDLSAWPGGTWTATDSLPAGLTAHKGGFCTRSFFPATGEVWSSGGYTGTAFVTTNQYLAAEACPSAATVAPAALAADTAGNGVLEPNEAAAIVAPTWRNTGASAIASLAGVASNFTGPAGPTYTINDNAASYGAIAAAAQASCTITGNCYAVTVTAATRPIVHWDTTITETVTPPGTVKDWTLHIGGSFTDVPTSNGFYKFVETILHKNVTGGCTATTYCPANSTTRDQMAVFVLVSKEPAGFVPPPCVAGTEMFTDVPAASPFCKWIEELARRGVVGGCATGLYCPANPATREQMAVFVLRTLDPALNPPACVTPVFADVPASSPFCKWIEELARRGVVSGCGGGNYCPTAAVTREQMSVFLAVTFSLTLYGV